MGLMSLLHALVFFCAVYRGRADIFCSTLDSFCLGGFAPTLNCPGNAVDCTIFCEIGVSGCSDQALNCAPISGNCLYDCSTTVPNPECHNVELIMGPDNTGSATIDCTNGVCTGTGTITGGFATTFAVIGTAAADVTIQLTKISGGPINSNLVCDLTNGGCIATCSEDCAVDCNVRNCSLNTVQLTCLGGGGSCVCDGPASSCAGVTILTSAPTEAPSSVPSFVPTSPPFLNPTGVPTVLPSHAPTDSPSFVPSNVPSANPSNAPTSVPSFTPSDSPSSVPSKSPSSSPSSVPSQSPSDSPTQVPSFIPSVEPSNSPTGSPSAVPSSVPSVLPSDTPSDVPSHSPSFIPSVQPSFTPSYAPSDAPSSLPSFAPSFVPSNAPSDVPSAVPSDVPSQAPSHIPSHVPSETPSNAPSDVPSDVPSYVPSNAPSSVPSKSPSKAPSDVPSDVPSFSPSAVPSRGPSSVPSAGPSDAPSDAPSAGPSVQPSSMPSDAPSSSPSSAPSSTPTRAPSDAPSHAPSNAPSQVPSAVPSYVPSFTPSDVPSHVPSQSPSANPSDAPSVVPSHLPSESPSTSPSVVPSQSPSGVPSETPSNAPSDVPSNIPSHIPTFLPSHSPTDVPSYSPSSVPSFGPSVQPSSVPSQTPSHLPSSIPTDVPSVTPSNAPSVGPTVVPTLSPTMVPTDAPSYAPSDAPSTVPTHVPSKAPSDTPSLAPTILPTDAPSGVPSHTPSRAPTVVPSHAPSGIPSVIPSGAPTVVPTKNPTHPPTFSPVVATTAYVNCNDNPRNYTAVVDKDHLVVWPKCEPGRTLTMNWASFVEFNTGNPAVQTSTTPAGGQWFPQIGATFTDAGNNSYSADGVINRVTVTVGSTPVDIEFRAWFFNEPVTAIIPCFGCPSLNVPSGSFKWDLRISNWPFQNPQNGLRAVLHVASNEAIETIVHGNKESVLELGSLAVFGLPNKYSVVSQSTRLATASAAVQVNSQFLASGELEIRFDFASFQPGEGVLYDPSVELLRSSLSASGAATAVVATGTVIGIVLAALFGMGCCICGSYFYLTQNKDKNRNSETREHLNADDDDEMMTPSGPVPTTQGQYVATSGRVMSESESKDDMEPAAAAATATAMEDPIELPEDEPLEEGDHIEVEMANMMSREGYTTTTGEGSGPGNHEIVDMIIGDEPEPQPVASPSVMSVPSQENEESKDDSMFDPENNDDTPAGTSGQYDEVDPSVPEAFAQDQMAEVPEDSVDPFVD